MLSNHPTSTHAIVIGMGDFEFYTPLEKCVNSAIQFQNILIDKRYLGLSPTDINEINTKNRKFGYFECLDALDKSYKAIENRNSKTRVDTVIFYYSGHGLGNPGNSESDLYLLVSDTKENELHQDTSISYSKIKRKLKGLNIKNIIFILDCCHAGIAQNSGGYINTDITPEHAVIYSSTRHEESFLSKHGEYTDFSHVFFEIIQNGVDTMKPCISLDEIDRQLQKHFKNSSNQKPGVRSSGNMMRDHNMFHNVCYSLDKVEILLRSPHRENRMYGARLFKNIINNYTPKELKKNATQIKDLSELLFTNILIE